MGISDRLIGKKNVNGDPQISGVYPEAAMPGGEVRIVGSGLRPKEFRRPSVRFNDVEGSLVVGSDDFVIARVPASASSGGITVSTNGHSSNAHSIRVATLIADSLHPVANPAVDVEGNIYVTFSGARGQKVPVSVFKIDTNYIVTPFLTELMNATAIAFDRNGEMYVSSRYEGAVYKVASNGTYSTYAESMGVATGIAFDREQNLYVGDRSGTIFKVAPDKQIFVFATLEPSVSAYHLATGFNGDLFVTGPTTSSWDSVYRIDAHGTVTTYFRGLGRPQGMALDVDGNLYVAASLAGQRGIVKITPAGSATLHVSGSGLVGLAFAPGRTAILATNDAVYHLPLDVQGLPSLNDLPV